MPAVAHDRPGISVPGGDLDIERVHPGIQPVVTKVRGCGLVIGMLACCANCRRRRLAACRSIRAPRDRWLLIKQALYPQIDEQITARLTESEAWRYEREHSREVLQQRLRAAQHAGHDLGAVIDQITAAPMDRARSISSVLHGHLQRLRPARPRPRRDCLCGAAPGRFSRMAPSWPAPGSAGYVA